MTKRSRTISFLCMTLLMLLMITACSQANSASPPVDQNQNQEEIPMETNDPEALNESSTLSTEDQEENITFDPIVLFELTEDDLSKSETEIPYYSFGNISFVSQVELEGFANGSYPWKGDPVQAAQILTQNLIPEGVSADQVSYNVVRVENQHQADQLTVVDMIVPKLGTFTIQLQHPNEAVFSYITKIVWQPESSEVLQQFEGSVTFFELHENWFDKPANDIPSFSKGSVSYFEEAAINSFNEGHSVSMNDPLVQTITEITNLVPVDYQPNPAIDEQLSKEISEDVVRKIVTSNDIEFAMFNNESSEYHDTVKVKIPNFGKYTVIVKRSSHNDTQIGVIQKIVFESIE